MKTARFITMTILFTVIAVLSVTGTVVSQNKGESSIDASCWREIENAYIAEVKEVLDVEGYRYSGITMTKIMEEDNPGEYTVLVHHRKINGLTAERKDMLREQLLCIEFPMEECSFSYEFF